MNSFHERVEAASLDGASACAEFLKVHGLDATRARARELCDHHIAHCATMVDPASDYGFSKGFFNAMCALISG